MNVGLFSRCSKKHTVQFNPHFEGIKFNTPCSTVIWCNAIGLFKISQPYLESALLDLAAKPGIPCALLLISWKGQERSSWSGKSQFAKVYCIQAKKPCSSLKEKTKTISGYLLWSRKDSSPINKNHNFPTLITFHMWRLRICYARFDVSNIKCNWFTCLASLLPM